MRKKINELFSMKIFRFLFVGGLNTIVGYGFFALFLFIGLNHNIAYLFATIIGMINSYVLNKKITFKSKEKNIKEIGKFIFVYLISFVLGLFIINVLINNFKINEYLAGFINLIMTTTISWFGHNYFSFSNKGEKNEENI